MWFPRDLHPELGSSGGICVLTETRSSPYMNATVCPQDLD